MAFRIFSQALRRLALGAAALRPDEVDRLLCRVDVTVGDGHRRALPRGDDGDGPAVAGRCVGVGRRPRAATADE